MTACQVQVFSGKIGSMRKALKSRAEFIFMNAPHEARGEEAEIRAAGGTGEHPKTWWHWEVMQAVSSWPSFSRTTAAAHWWTLHLSQTL